MTSLSTTFLLKPWLMSSADELLSLSGSSKADCTVLFNGTHEPTTTPTIIDQRDSRLQLRKKKPKPEPRATCIYLAKHHPIKHTNVNISSLFSLSNVCKAFFCLVSRVDVLIPETNGPSNTIPSNPRLLPGTQLWRERETRNNTAPCRR